MKMRGHVLSDTFEDKVEPSRRVCIIGAGASGLATLKVLAETRQVQSGQWSMVTFEERDNVGGIWYPLWDTFFTPRVSHFLAIGILLLPLMTLL